MAKLSEVASIVSRLAAVHNVPVTVDQVKAYYLVLGNMARMALVEAAHHALTEIKFMPKPAELYPLARDAQTRYHAGNPFDEAAQWVMYLHGYQSTDDMTEADIDQVRRETVKPEPWMQSTVLKFAVPAHLANYRPVAP